MELAELKSIWHLINADIIKNRFVGEQVLVETIHMKSQTEIGKIRTALQFKLAIGGLVTLLGVALLIGILIAPQKLHTLDYILNTTEIIIFYSTLIVSLTTMLLFNYNAYRKIVAAETHSLPLKKSLELVIGGMKRTMIFNIYSDTLIFPVIFTWLFYAYAFRDDYFIWDWRALVFISVPIVMGTLAYYIQRYLQGLKFGKYVTRLESYLDELR